jgi:hypothetical protein
MKQISLWFSLFSYAVLASPLTQSCARKDGALIPQSISKTSLTVDENIFSPAADSNH